LVRAGVEEPDVLLRVIAAQVVELRPADLAASALIGAADVALQPLLDDPRLLV